MKNVMKKSLLTLSILLATTQLIQTDGGGWAGGTALGLTSGLIIGSAMSKNNSGGGGSDNTSAAITTELRNVRKEKRRVSQQYKQGKISEADYSQQMKSLNSQISDLQSQL